MHCSIAKIILFITVITVTPGFGQSPSGAPVQEIKRLEDEWAAAYLRGDKAAFDRIVADDYFRTDESGNTADKTGDMKLVQVPPASVKATLLNEDVQVRVYGATAVVTGLLVSTVGDNLSFRSRFTDVFVRRDGRWKVIARHYSRIPATRKAIKLDPKSYGDYAGEYQIAPGVFYSVRSEDGRLWGMATGQQKMELMPESEIEFFLSSLNARFVFVRDRDGRVARLIIDQEGQKTIAERK